MMFPVGKDAVFLWLYRDLWYEFSKSQREAIRLWWKKINKIN